MNIEKSNKLLAEFMGIEIKKSHYPNGLYHVSWDALMPVIEKIERMFVKYSCERYENITRPATFYCEFMTYSQERWDRTNYFIRAKVTKTRFDSTYHVVVNFILWYNKFVKRELYRVWSKTKGGGSFAIDIKANSYRQAKDLVYKENNRVAKNTHYPYRSIKLKISRKAQNLTK